LKLEEACTLASIRAIRNGYFIYAVGY
jgi:hypothetical protein